MILKNSCSPYNNPMKLKLISPIQHPSNTQLISAATPMRQAGSPLKIARAFLLKGVMVVLLILSVGGAWGQTTLLTENFESYSTSANLPNTGTNQWIQYLIGANNNPWGIGSNSASINGNRSLTIYHNNGTEYTYRNSRTRF